MSLFFCFFFHYSQLHNFRKKNTISICYNCVCVCVCWTCLCVTIYQLISSGRTSVIISVSVSDADSDSDSDADFLNYFLRYPRSRVLQVPPSERISIYIFIFFFISIFIYFICTINCKGVPASTRPKKITLGSHYSLWFFLLACIIYICFFLQNTSLQWKKKILFFILYYKSN